MLRKFLFLFVFISQYGLSQLLTIEEEKILLELNGSIQSNKGTSKDYFNRAILYIKLGDSLKALNDYTHAIEIKSNQDIVFNALLNRGSLYQKQKNYNDALEDYNSALEIQPKSALVMNNRGFLRLEQGLYSDAISDFNLAIEWDKFHELAYVNKIEVYRIQGKHKEAIETCNALILAIPNDVRSYVARADYYVSLGNYFEALNDWNLAELVAENQADFYIERSKFKDDVLNDDPGAINDCEKAISLNPLNGMYYFMKSRPLFDLQEFEKVIENCNKAIQLDSNLGDAYVMRANVEDMFGLMNDAIADYEKAISIKPNDLDAFNQLLILYGSRYMYKDALKAANRYLLLDSSNYEMISNRAKINFSLNDLTATMRDIERLKAIDPKNSFGFYFSGFIHDSIGNKNLACQNMLIASNLNSIQAHEYVFKKCSELMDPKAYKLEKIFYEAVELENQRKFPEAIKKYDELIGLAPDSAVFYYNRGKIKRHLEMHLEAIKDYNLAIAKYPNEVSFWVSRAISEYYSKDTLGAIATYKRSIEIDPLYAMSYFNLASLLFELKNYQESIKYLDLAIFYQADYVKAHLLLGECYVSIKNYTKACEVFKRAEDRGINEAFAKRVKICNL